MPKSKGSGKSGNGDDTGTVISIIIKPHTKTTAKERDSLMGVLSSSTVPKEKVTKNEADYKRAEESSDEYCDNCDNFFRTSRQCRVVAGRIEPSFISTYYEPRDDNGSSDKAEAGVSNNRVLEHDTD